MKALRWHISLVSAWTVFILAISIWAWPESKPIWMAVVTAFILGPFIWCVGGVLGYWMAVAFDRTTGLGFSLPGSPLAQRHPRNQVLMGVVLFISVLAAIPFTWRYRENMAQRVRPSNAKPGIVVSGKPSGPEMGWYKVSYVVGAKSYEEARAHKREAICQGLSEIDCWNSGVVMSDKSNPRTNLQSTLADFQGSIGAELAELQSGNLPGDPFSDFYDQQSKALSSASALQSTLAAHDIQLLLAVAKHRKRERGDMQGYSPIPDIAKTTGFSSRVAGKALKRFEKEKLVILSSCCNWVKLIDSGLKVVDDVMEPWREVIRLRQQVSKITSVLEAFHIDIDAACKMVGTPEHIWLQRTGLYGAALMQSFGKLTPDMHNEDSSTLMHKWLWELPGYTSPETGVAERHHNDLNERRLQPLIKSK